MVFFEILLLVFVLLTILSIVWSTVQTGISPMMSSSKARSAMLAILSESLKEQPDDGPFIDLGSGWGTLVIAAARQHPSRQVIGYELSWFPWLVSVLRKYCLGLDNLNLYRKDFKHADLSEAAVLLCYLYPGGMIALEEKLQHEQQLHKQLGRTLIISNTFALPAHQPMRVIKLDDLYRSPIYLYHWLPKS